MISQPTNGMPGIYSGMDRLGLWEGKIMEL